MQDIFLKNFDVCTYQSYFLLMRIIHKGFRRPALAATLSPGSLAGSQARQIRTEIYFPRALGISVLITSDSCPALRRILFALVC